MISSEQALATRIRGEVAELDRSVLRVSHAWARAATATADQDYFLDAVALNLHGFYSGIERLFELTARHIDGALPHGDTWHRELAAQMARQVPDARPAVISPDVATDLDEFRRFRHLVRNVYATDLIPARMQGLVEHLPVLWSRLSDDLVAFAAFLEQVSADQA